MIRLRACTGVVLAFGLAGCTSAPLHFYTLIPIGRVASEPMSNPTTAPAGPAGATAFQFELLPVSIPAQVDQPQLVIRQGGQGVALVDSERWIAPLADEVRGALSAELMRKLHTQDASGLPTTDKPSVRIKVDVRRFDSVPGSYALIDAAWSVRALHGAALTCTSHLSEPVGAGYAALVQGHQQALGALAAQIAAASAAMMAGQTPTCPTVR